MPIRDFQYYSRVLASRHRRKKMGRKTIHYFGPVRLFTYGEKSFQDNLIMLANALGDRFPTKWGSDRTEEDRPFHVRWHRIMAREIIRRYVQYKYFTPKKIALMDQLSRNIVKRLNANTLRPPGGRYPLTFDDRKPIIFREDEVILARRIGGKSLNAIINDLDRIAQKTYGKGDGEHILGWSFFAVSQILEQLRAAAFTRKK